MYFIYFCVHYLNELCHSSFFLFQVWSVVRQTDTEKQVISAWTGFNILTSDNETVVKDNIGYLQPINAPASEMSTVQEILRECLRICKTLDLEAITCVMDQALYCKASEICWSNEIFRPIVLRMGTFHTLCRMVCLIGRRFGTAGLRDLAVESGVIAEGSVEAVLDGRKYNRSIRFLKIVYEALFRLAWQGFLSWLENHPDGITKVHDAMIIFSNLHDLVTPKNFKETISNQKCGDILKLFDQYLDILRHSQGDLSSFWMSCFDMIEIILGAIRATREGNWSLHMAMIRDMIPWFFAYDLQNYARYLPVYYRQMSRLHIDHPSVYQHYVTGGFGAQLSDKNPFGRIPIDQTIEETANKDTQTAGGTKGFSLKPGSVTRYYLTAEYRSKGLHKLRDMTNAHNTGMLHKDLETSRIARDEQDVEALTQLLSVTWINPFQETNDLIHLATGLVATTEVKDDLLLAKEKGEQAYKSFVQDRLDSTTKGFHDCLPRLKLKTFGNIKKSRKVTTANKEIILKADQKLFGHLVLVATSRNLDMKKVLEHPLGPLPWALANCDGTLKQTDKSSLSKALEKKVPPGCEVSQPSTCIIDGMAMIHKINGDNLTFSEVAQTLFTSTMHASMGSERVDVVFDVYKDISIKNAERDARSFDSGVHFSCIQPGHRIQQWRSLLRSSRSKTALTQFIADEWVKPAYRERLGSMELYVTALDKCLRVSKSSGQECPDLSCSQEEADGRMLLHAKHAALKSSSVIFVSEDTDVMILLLAFSQRIDAQLVLRRGRKGTVRYLDISELSRQLGRDLCAAILGLHAFTGNDSVSAFAGKGKLSGLKLVTQKPSMQQAMVQLGQSWSLTEDLFQKLQGFVCCMYSPSTSIDSVNELRFNLFRLKKGEMESSQLPPCRDTLWQHSLRANYQAALWRSSLEADPEVPSPDNHGWVVNDGQLSIKWMTGSPAPDVVLQLMSCKCKKECKTPKCSCIANSLRCTPACVLETCSNMSIEDSYEDVLTDDSDDSDED